MDIFYLSYKKVSIVSARDLVYVKTYKKLDKNDREIKMD